MNGVGGAVRFCEECHRRRCIAPHTKCVACRPKRVQLKAPRSAESKARRLQRQRRSRILAGLAPIFEGWA